jgi:hypothetical protein
VEVIVCCFVLLLWLHCKPVGVVEGPDGGSRSSCSEALRCAVSIRVGGMGEQQQAEGP